MASSIDNTAWLQWMESLMGGVSRQTYAATFPPDRYYCLLDELPLHLIPQRALKRLRIRDRQSLFFNPDCIITAGELPEELAARSELVSGFALQGTIAWVRNQVNRALLPFWLGPRFEVAICDLKPGQPIPDSLDDESCALLAGAGILIYGAQTAEQRKRWDAMVATSGPQFQESGYVPLADLIHPFHVAALRRYYRYLIRTGSIQLGDGQSPRRYIAYNDPVARFFHDQIAAVLTAVAGEPLQPSYAYLASYLSGAQLKKHTDRPQCEFSVTFCLDFSPEPKLETPWPIRLDTAKGTVTVYQALGDGLAYRGTRLPHYRDVLAPGRTSTSIFFHYVPVNFTGSLM